MVRISHAWVWSEWIGDLIDESVCMCCKKHDWVRGHIIPDKEDPITNKKPTEMVENIWPICVSCNKDDMEYPTNLHYALYLGTVTKSEVDEKLLSIRASLKDNLVKRCEEYKCKNVAHGKASYCRVHEYGITPSNLYDFLYRLRKNIKKKTARLMELERDPLWLDDPEFVALYKKDLKLEIDLLVKFGFDL